MSQSKLKLPPSRTTASACGELDLTNVSICYPVLKIFQVFTVIASNIGTQVLMGKSYQDFKVLIAGPKNSTNILNAAISPSQDDLICPTV